jgi:hypothetical protein
MKRHRDDKAEKQMVEESQPNKKKKKVDHIEFAHDKLEDDRDSIHIISLQERMSDKNHRRSRTLKCKNIETNTLNRR